MSELSRLRGSERYEVRDDERSLFMSIPDNVAEIRERIARAARKSGREPGEITFVGVTKTIDAGRVCELLDCGVAELGENRVQELLSKYGEVGDRGYMPEWHLIGHLQTNKVRYIIDKVTMIHSVDSVRLAEEIDKRAQAIGGRMDVLIEVNAGGEESKFGVRPEDTVAFAREIDKFSGICVRGLMTVAPFVEEPEENREIFRKMRNLLIDITGKISNNEKTPVLSMGMTNDYEIAIEEGATLVRIGTGIFGTRA